MNTQEPLLFGFATFDVSLSISRFFCRVAKHEVKTRMSNVLLNRHVSMCRNSVGWSYGKNEHLR